jgi:hypothetical protein
MNGTVFNIGVTTCGFTMATIVEYHPQNVIGTFWLPSTEKDYNKLTCKWVDYVLEENQAQALLDDIDIFRSEPHLYTHMVILLTGNPHHPGDYSFMAGITRFLKSTSLLQALAKHNIPAHTEISYPDLFDDKSAENADYNIWGRLNLNDWNEYIRLSLVSVYGQDMLQQWWQRLAKSS